MKTLIENLKNILKRVQLKALACYEALAFYAVVVIFYLNGFFELILMKLHPIIHPIFRALGIPCP